MKINGRDIQGLLVDLDGVLYVGGEALPVAAHTGSGCTGWAGHVTGEHFQGGWFDIGTPERLAKLRALHGPPPEN